MAEQKQIVVPKKTGSYPNTFQRKKNAMQKEKPYPLISVVVPAYNAEKLIACSLESVIAQDYPNLEIIVVNDASKDGTEQAARRVLEGCGRPFSIIAHKKTAAYLRRVTQASMPSRENSSGSWTRTTRRSQTWFPRCMP